MIRTIWITLNTILKQKGDRVVKKKDKGDSIIKILNCKIHDLPNLLFLYDDWMQCMMGDNWHVWINGQFWKLMKILVQLYLFIYFFTFFYFLFIIFHFDTFIISFHHHRHFHKPKTSNWDVLLSQEGPKSQCSENERTIRRTPFSSLFSTFFFFFFFHQ